jgi:hypothetical protein
MPEYTYPGRRIAYDEDGTLGFLLHSERLTPELKGTLIELPQGALQGLNADVAGGLYIQGRRFVGSGASFQIIPGTSWGEATYDGQRNYLVLFFPDAMRLRGWYSNLAIMWQNHQTTSGSSSGTTMAYPEFDLEVSHDTTNGQDGEWHVLDYREANQFNPLPSSAPSTLTWPVAWHREDGSWYSEVPENYSSTTNTPRELLRVNSELEEYRDGRESGRGWFPLYGGNARNVRAVRISVSATGPRSSIAYALLQLHLYGEPDVNAGLTRLAVVDPLTDEELITGPTWGDVDFKTGGETSFGIKNLSPTETAEGVVVGVGDSYPPGMPTQVWYYDPLISSGSMAKMYYINQLAEFLEVSLDGLTWAPSVALGDLAPEQTVEIFARLLPPIGWTLPPPYFANAMDRLQDPIPTYVDPGIIGLRFARFTSETEGWS